MVDKALIYKQLSRLGIKHATVNANGSVTVRGDVDLSQKRLKFLPFNFAAIHGSLDCSHNSLDNFAGFPEHMSGHLNISNNKFTTLDGLPKGKYDLNASYNELKTLEGCPEVMIKLNVSNNHLVNLLGAPKNILGLFNANDNKLTTLDGAPESVENFMVKGNQLTTLEFGPATVLRSYDCSSNLLTSLEGAPEMLQDKFVCSHNKSLTNLAHSPKVVGCFFAVNCGLVSLHGVSEYVNDSLDVSHNPLEHLRGISKFIQGDVVLQNTPIIQFYDIPETLGGVIIHSHPQVRMLDMEEFYHDNKMIVELNDVSAILLKHKLSDKLDEKTTRSMRLKI